MNKKKLKIIGAIIAFALCFPLHFLYEKFPNFITSILAPVNQSIWEHMKILFGSIILAGVIQKIIIIVKNEKMNNVCFSNFVGAITSIPIFLIIYLPLYYLIGENMIISISVMLITIIIAEIISYIIMEKRQLNLEKLTIFLVIFVYIIFTILTYYPLKIELFKDPETLEYGINKASE
ncbi:MAG: hypothetical protein IJB71_04085 [Bacilli bacterium]|nr:hypothetical protein [Bacilli bacterium]